MRASSTASAGSRRADTCGLTGDRRSRAGPRPIEAGLARESAARQGNAPVARFPGRSPEPCGGEGGCRLDRRLQSGCGRPSGRVCRVRPRRGGRGRILSTAKIRRLKRFRRRTAGRRSRRGVRESPHPAVGMTARLERSPSRQSRAVRSSVSSWRDFLITGRFRPVGNRSSGAAPPPPGPRGSADRRPPGGRRSCGPWRRRGRRRWSGGCGRWRCTARRAPGRPGSGPR